MGKLLIIFFIPRPLAAGYKKNNQQHNFEVFLMTF